MPAFPSPSAPGPPGVSLDDMPVELLVNIGMMTRDGSTRALWALSCTSRQFHAIFNPILYKYDATQMSSFAMCWGAQHGVFGTMSKSLNSGGDVNTWSRYERLLHMVTPLICAISTGRGIVVQWLLAKGASPSIGGRPLGFGRMSEWRPPLYWALRQGSLEIVTQIFDAGCQRVSFNGDGSTATHVAAAYGHHDLLWLLPPGERDMIDSKGNTPLHTAAQGFHVNDAQPYLHSHDAPRPSRQASSLVLRTLVGDGAAIDARNQDGNTPLYLAFSARQWSAAVTLMELGARPSISAQPPISAVPRTWHPYPGETFSASQRDDRERAVRMLAEKGKAEKGTDVQSWDSMGPENTALTHLCYSHRFASFPSLPSGKTKSDEDAKDSELIMFLLELGADTNGKSATGQTPLHILVARSVYNLDNVPSAPLRRPYTSSACPFDLITELMRHGASLDRMDRTWKTPLTQLLRFLEEGEKHMPPGNAYRAEYLAQMARFLLWTAWVEDADPSDETKLPVVQAFGMDVLHKDDPYRARFASMSGKQG